MKKTWEELEKERQDAVKQLDWNTAKMTALDQAGILEKLFAGSGRKLKIKILAAPDSCEACKKKEGKTYTTEEALAAMPIPHSDCSHKIGFCRCMWLVDTSSLKP